MESSSGRDPAALVESLLKELDRVRRPLTMIWATGCLAAAATMIAFHPMSSLGVLPVAAAFADANGRIQFAIHIHGPSFRFPGEVDREELGNRVAATAQRIEAQLNPD